MGRRGGRERWMSNTNTGTNSARLTASRVCCFHRCRADVGFFSLNTVFLPREVLLPLSPGLCVRINSLFRRRWWMGPVNGESMKTYSHELDINIHVSSFKNWAFIYLSIYASVYILYIIDFYCTIDSFLIIALKWLDLSTLPWTVTLQFLSCFFLTYQYSTILIL